MQYLLVNYEQTAAVILFCIGFSTMLLHKNLLKKIIGMDIMDAGIFLFLACQGFIKGRVAPIVVGVHQPGSRGPGAYGHRRLRLRDGVDARADRAPVLPLSHPQPG